MAAWPRIESCIIYTTVGPPQLTNHNCNPDLKRWGIRIDNEDDDDRDDDDDDEEGDDDDGKDDHNDDKDEDLNKNKRSYELASFLMKS